MCNGARVTERGLMYNVLNIRVYIGICIYNFTYNVFSPQVFFSRGSNTSSRIVYVYINPLTCTAPSFTLVRGRFFFYVSVIIVAKSTVYMSRVCANAQDSWWFFFYNASLFLCKGTYHVYTRYWIGAADVTDCATAETRFRCHIVTFVLSHRGQFSSLSATRRIATNAEWRNERSR